MKRRAFLKNTAALLAPPALAQRPASGFACVGCYTTAQRQARGDGIHVYRVDPQTGAWSHVQRVGDLVNPSFLITSRDRRFLYSVHGDERYATSFSVDTETGNLTLLNRADTGGMNGVHQAIDPSGKFMVVANYGSGTVAVLPIESDGRLRDQVQLATLTGQPGPHRVEQTSSHPHHVVFDPSGHFVAVPDKGLDRIFVFRFDGKLTPTDQGSVVARPGSGPRHVAFHPRLPVAWVLNELSSSATTYHFDAMTGELRPMQIVPTLPADYTGPSTAAEIAVSSDGRFVYCSNRGHDSVTIFATDPKTGVLKASGWVPSGGKVPRFITFDPAHRFFYAANEQGDTIVAFRVDANGGLKPTGQVIKNLSPVTIAFTG